jgi:hypothetical protein
VDRARVDGVATTGPAARIRPVSAAWAPETAVAATSSPLTTVIAAVLDKDLTYPPENHLRTSLQRQSGPFYDTSAGQPRPTPGR